MIKKTVRLSFLFLMLILMVSFFSIGVISQEENESIDSGSVESIDSETDLTDVSNENVVEGTVDDVSNEVEDAVSDENIVEDNSVETRTLEDEAKANEKNVIDELEKEYSNEEIIDPGLTPDSAFYFIDEFFDRFGDKIKNREEKIAEIKAMIEKGDIEAARKSLEKYEKYAEELEKEADPEKKEEAKRSAAAIHRALKDIKDKIPEDKKKEFYDSIVDKENNIITAVEISSKIKELCVQLSELDPIEYARVCKTDKDAPKWQKKLDKRLTKEQQKEAEKFGEILTECFRTSGRQCRCEDISFYDFSVFCEKISSLSVKCDEGDEDACREMDEASEDMPELPPHLQDVFDDIERKFLEVKYEEYIPEPCVEAGVKSPKECMLIMIEYHAPPECREPIKRAIEEGKIKGERDAREICDKIMFEKNAPPECIEEGIKDPKECGKFMFKLYAPQECIEAGLTGELRSDERKCKELMEEKERRGEFGPRGRGPEDLGPPGARCMKIKDPNDRLICFEESIGRTGERYGVGNKFKERPSGEITWQCKENRIHWPPDCERFMREEWPEIERRKREEREREMERKERQWREYNPEYPSPEERRLEEDRRRDYPEEYRPPEGEGPSGEEYVPPGENIPPEEYVPPEDGTPYTPDDEAIPGPDDGGPTEPETTSSESSETTSEPESEPSSESTSEPPPEESSPEPGVTGGVIFSDPFLDYYYR